MTGRLDADPVNAPAPTDPRDPRTAAPALLPHNSGEQWSGLGKITLPGRPTGSPSDCWASTPRTSACSTIRPTSTTSTWPRLSGSAAISSPVTRNTPAGPVRSKPLIVDLRVGRFIREFLRGTLDGQVDYALGALTGKQFHFIGEDAARAQQPSTDPIPGLRTPGAEHRSPWGVPAFFVGTGSRGDLGWSHFGETRGQMDLTFGASERVDLYAGGEVVAAAGPHLSAGVGLPPGRRRRAPGGDLDLLAHQQRRVSGGPASARRIWPSPPAFATTSSMPAASWPLSRAGRSGSSAPAFAVSTVLHGATFVASYGRFTQAPDYQYLVDAAFDDTTRTGRFRRGNPNIGFEDATQYEFSLRVRPTPVTSLRLGVYVKRLDGLVASVPLGSTPTPPSSATPMPAA